MRPKFLRAERPAGLDWDQIALVVWTVVLLVVCATHGSGDIPTNITPLAETLERDRPDLSRHRYGMIALGDMTYQDTFCGGGKKVDRVFELCGARRIGDRLEVDASSQPLPDEEALSWVEDWKAMV